MMQPVYLACTTESAHPHELVSKYTVWLCRHVCLLGGTIECVVVYCRCVFNELSHVGVGLDNLQCSVPPASPFGCSGAVVRSCVGRHMVHAYRPWTNSISCRPAPLMRNDDKCGDKCTYTTSIYQIHNGHIQGWPPFYLSFTDNAWHTHIRLFHITFFPTYPVFAGVDVLGAFTGG